MKPTEGFAMADNRNLPKVDNIMLLAYMRESDAFNMAEIRGAKMMLSSRDAYVDTSVGYVEVKRENSLCFVKGKVTPEHRVRTKNYSVTATINEFDDNITNVMCHDCAASQGGCKHSICFVMWLIKRTEEPSVTSIQCYWTKPRLSEAVTKEKCVAAKELGTRREVAAVTLPASLRLSSFLEMCRNRNIKDSLIINYNSTDIEGLENYSMFKLTLAYIAQEPPSISFETLKMFAETKMNKQIVENIEEKTRLQADCKLWHTLRQGRVTASKLYECTKCNTDDGALVKAILGGYKIPETKAMSRGKRLEKEVLKEVEKSMSLKISDCGLQLVTPFVGASPDGVYDGDDGFTVEIKCPTSAKTVGNYFKDNQVSAKCKAQIQIQMYAMNKKKALFCIADPNFESNKKYTVHWLHYDRLYVEKLIYDAEIFWMKFIFPKMIAVCNS